MNFYPGLLYSLRPVMLGEILTNFESMESVTHKHALTNIF